MKKAKSERLFEVSWEVCNKVGGIYTVVMSKAGLMKKAFEEYYLVGPYFEDKAEFEFEEEEPPEPLAKAFAEMAQDGIPCHFGTWKVKGEPKAILVDAGSVSGMKDGIKKQLWERYHIDSWGAGWDYEEPTIWSWAIGMLVERVMRHEQKITTVHAHEWLSGSALLYCHMHKVDVGTVFTTHATMLGRSIAGSNKPLYEMLDQIDPKKEAYELKVQTKWLHEKACAEHAHVFTTVSEITAIEAEKLLGRKPDVLVLNGLDIDKFPTIEETSIKHITTREKIREFLTYYFFPYYSFDVEHNLIFFVLGRYEFRNKGLDIFIKALGRLNDRLKEEETRRTISVFFWIPSAQHGLRTEILENKNFFKHIKSYVDLHSDEIMNKITSTILSGKKLSVGNLLSDEFRSQLRKDSLRFKREGYPPMSTHYIDEEKDAMVTALKSVGLENCEDDKVKAIIYPVYLDGADEMLNLAYYDAISGCHLGVFPSYYEPWGYTPLESAAMGVPALTTDMAGFGRFIAKHEKKKEGIFVLERLGRPEEEVVAEFTDVLHSYAKLHRPGRVHNKMVAKNLAALADWKKLIVNYIDAHDLAVEKMQHG